MNLKIYIKYLTLATAISFVLNDTAIASDLGALQQAALRTGGSAPWISVLKTVTDAITGPTSQIIGVLVIAVFGISVATGQEGAIITKASKLGLGLSIVYSATSWCLPLFVSSSGAQF